MAEFIKGDVVALPFPFSDLTRTKRHPALVVALPRGDDVVLCQITSQTVRDANAISIRDDDFENGGLKQISNV